MAVARETGPDLIVLAWGQDLAPGHARVVSETLAHSEIPVLLLPVQEATVPGRGTIRLSKRRTLPQRDQMRASQAGG